MEVAELALTLIGPFLAGAVGSTMLWLVFGIPKITKKIEAKEIELKAYYKDERDKTVAELMLFYEKESEIAFGKVSLLLSNKLPEIANSLAPVIIDAMVTQGAALMAGRSNGQQSMAKAAVGSGVDIGGILSQLQGGNGGNVDLGGILSQLQGGSNGASVAPINPLTMILGQFVPKKYQALLSAIMPQRPQAVGSTASAYVAQGGNGGYNPGVRR